MTNPPTKQDVASAAAQDDGLAAFTEYFCRNYPGPDTIIGRPEWHAPKLFRAAKHAITEATRTPASAREAHNGDTAMIDNAYLANMIENLSNGDDAYYTKEAIASTIQRLREAQGGEAWVLVPRVITPEMEDAADQRDDDEPASDWGKMVDAPRQAIWDAMIAAAPTPPAQPAKVGDGEWAHAWDKGPFRYHFHTADRHSINSDDFTHDVALIVTGDFATDADHRSYCEWLTGRLNAALPQQGGTVVGDDVVERALDAQPFEDLNDGTRVWQMFKSGIHSPNRIMRAALEAALSSSALAGKGA